MSQILLAGVLLAFVACKHCLDKSPEFLALQRQTELEESIKKKTAEKILILQSRMDSEQIQMAELQAEIMQDEAVRDDLVDSINLERDRRGKAELRIASMEGAFN